MIFLYKARWPMFVIGLVLIGIGGYGLVTNQPWGNVFSSISTIFGTTISFAQIFVTFPTTPILPYPTSVTNRATQPAPNARIMSQQQGGFSAPPYNISQLMPTSGPQKRYIGSGIALWLSVLCIFCLTTLYVEAGGFSSTSPLTLEEVSQIQSYLIFAILADICILCSLRGLQGKQAQYVGFIGTIAILAIGASLLLDIFTSFISLVGWHPGQPLSPEILSAISTLGNIDNFFNATGYILLGLSFLIGKIYSTWMGSIAVIFGCVSFFIALQSVSPSHPQVPFLFVTLGNFALMALNMACGWILFRILPPR